MGWYAHGPGNMDYKYGNVVAVAEACGLGTLYMIPRVAAIDEDGDHLEVDDLEFLGPLQRRMQELDLKWTPELDFTGRGREALVVRADVEVDDMLEGIVEQVRAHVDSIIGAIEQSMDEPAPIVELMVSADFLWELDKKDYPRLIDWLNEPLAGQTKITEAGLREGTLEGDTFSSLGGTFGWYRPPAELVHVESTLEEPRLFALHGLAQALLADEDLFLDQPDDRYQIDAWSAGDD